MSQLVPPPAGSDPTLIRFVAVAAPPYSLSSPDSEDVRLQWLRKTLADNGYDPDHYSIVSRKVVAMDRALLGESHRIFYDVRVQPIAQ
ncbi:hypothetical protein [Chitinasiproducens palmae]|nr:hypothetical protein [Chitinasiproducens palmae]